MCDVSHRSNIALQRSKHKRFLSGNVSHAKTRGLLARMAGLVGRDEHDAHEGDMGAH
jgi:hypothetical protein